jgi:ketosteroid isomerase-like protein
MRERENVELIKRAYAAFGRGDLPGLMEMVANDLDFQHPMPQAIWPFAGKRAGRVGLTEFIQGSPQAIAREHFEPEEIIAQGDFVVVLLSEEMKAKTTGISINNPHVHVFKIVDGKIAQFRIFEDTAPIIAALQGYRK